MKNRFWLLLPFILFAHLRAQAQSVQQLVELALARSPEIGVARSDVQIQQFVAKSARDSKYIPQVGLALSSQRLSFDRLKDDGAGKLISNDGVTTAIGLTISYDLQKLLGPESELAQLSLHNMELQNSLIRRAVERDVKKATFIILEIREEIASFRSALDRISKVSKILDRERGNGINTNLEGGQFRVQRDLVEAELLVRNSDLDIAYGQLANLLGEGADVTKKRFNEPLVITPPRFSQPKALIADQLATAGDPDLMKILRADAGLARQEASQFTRVSLPVVYLKGVRDNSSVFSSDGPQTTIEAGITIPIEAIVTRGTLRSMLGAKAQKAAFLAERAIVDYSNQIRLQVAQLQRAALQNERMLMARKDSQNLLDQSFKYYGQKRIDAVGATDIFQKHLQTVRNVLMNQMQMQIADAELEYLLGQEKK